MTTQEVNWHLPCSVRAEVISEWMMSRRWTRAYAEVHYNEALNAMRYEADSAPEAYVGDCVYDAYQTFVGLDFETYNRMLGEL